MSALHVEVGQKVVVHGDPRTHVVSWTSHRAWDSVCEHIIEDYQPDYYTQLLEADRDAMERRRYAPHPYPEDTDLGDKDTHTEHPALQLQVAPDDAPITCLVCLIRWWHLDDAATHDEDADDNPWPYP